MPRLEVVCFHNIVFYGLIICLTSHKITAFPQYTQQDISFFRATVSNIRVLTENSKSHAVIHFRQPIDKEKQWSYRCAIENMEDRYNLKI